MMKNDNIQSNHRGSSPPFQDPEHDFFDWMKTLNAIGQRDEMAPEHQRARQPGDERTEFSHKADGESQQGREEDFRWQDDGGMSGEVA
jgi:hypothetical protein